MPKYLVERRHVFVVDADNAKAADALTRQQETFWISEERGESETVHTEEITVAGQLNDELAGKPTANADTEAPLSSALN